MTCQKPTSLRVDTEMSDALRKNKNARHGLLALALLPLSLILLAAPVSAHIQLDAPNGGETLTAGDQVDIRWHVQIEHNLDNWDLWYSITGDGGPWIPIATDLPPGDGTAGAMHNHLWTVPAEDSTQVRVRVRQDNFGMDYLDISDADLTILSGPPVGSIFADGFESGDTSAWSTTVP